MANIQLAGGRVTEVELVPNGEGVLMAEFLAAEAGPAGVTITAHANTPQGQSVTWQIQDQIEVRPPYPYWIWLVSLVAVASVTGTVAFRRRQRRQPIVKGTLRILEGPDFPLLGRTAELETLRLRAITVGAGRSTL